MPDPFTEPTTEESAALNACLSGLDEAEFHVRGLAPHGKAVPYIGWLWRDVDFTRPFNLGHCGQFVGFMENNKWDYPEWEVSAEGRQQIIALARTILCEGPSDANLQALCDYIQTQQPENAKQKADRQLEANRELTARINGWPLS